MSQENFLQQNFAARIGGSNFGKDTKIYKFEKIKRAKRAAAAENPGVELICVMAIEEFIIIINRSSNTA